MPIKVAEKGVAVRKHDLTHARHDPAHCLAPGLFRSLQRGERRRCKLHVVYNYGDGKRIEFSGPEPLGAGHLASCCPPSLIQKRGGNSACVSSRNGTLSSRTHWWSRAAIGLWPVKWATPILTTRGRSVTALRGSGKSQSSSRTEEDDRASGCCPSTRVMGAMASCTWL